MLMMTLVPVHAAGPGTTGPDNRGAAARKIDGSMLADRFVEFLEKKAPWPQEAMEIASVRIYPSRLWVPEGELFIEIMPPRTDTFLGRITSMISIKVDGVEVRRARASAHIEVFMPVVAATRYIRKGEVIAEEDLVQRVMPISRLKGRYLDDPGKAVGKAARRTIRAGQVVSADLLREPVVMRRGQKVMILAASDCLVVKVPGEALENGGLGDTVKVRNIMSRRTVIARVRDSRTVVVSF
jgi:flagella basal body P-ring formation protein FlgA